jgi:hypothetical protein
MALPLLGTVWRHNRRSERIDLAQGQESAVPAVRVDKDEHGSTCCEES